MPLFKVGKVKDGFRNVEQVDTGEPIGVKSTMQAKAAAARDDAEREDFPSMDEREGGVAAGEPIFKGGDVSDPDGDDIDEITNQQEALRTEAESAFTDLVDGLHENDIMFALKLIPGLTSAEQVDEVRALEMDRSDGGRDLVLDVLDEVGMAMLDEDDQDDDDEADGNEVVGDDDDDFDKAAESLKLLLENLHFKNTAFAVALIGDLTNPTQIEEVRKLELTHPRGGDDGRKDVILALDEAVALMGANTDL